MRSAEHRGLIAAIASTAIFGVAMAAQIVRRSALTMDELHSLLLGKSWAAGEVLSFYVGSVTRYEGGSWLIAWPVSWLLRLGVPPVASTSWAAGIIALVTVCAASVWVARTTERAGAALAVGALAACVPELVHYSYRAWGNLCEALVILPLGALAYGRWIDRGRSLRAAPLLGLLLALGVVLSYFHLITAAVFVAIQGVEAWPERRRRALVETAAVVGVALAAFGLWVFLTYPDPGDALIVRDGNTLTGLLPSLLLPRLDRVVLALPGAWIGQHLAATPLRLAAGVGLSGLLLGAGIAGWRAGGRIRWAVLFAVGYLPALSVGHALLGAPDVYRYHLPLFAIAVVLIASWGALPSLAAVLCGLTFWLPGGLEIPYQNPAEAYLELGGNAVYRDHADPHVKFKALRAQTPALYRPWLAFGYGHDLGQRHGRVRRGMQQTLDGEPYAADIVANDPHFSLYRPPDWVDWWEELGEAPDQREFLLGLGMGLVADATLDATEFELLAHLPRPRRDVVLEGVGAALQRALRAGRDLAGWDVGLLRAPVADYAAVGRGMARVRRGAWPAGRDLGLSGDAATALAEGQTAAADHAWRAMANVRLIPTPE